MGALKGLSSAAIGLALISGASAQTLNSLPLAQSLAASDLLYVLQGGVGKQTPLSLVPAAIDICPTCNATLNSLTLNSFLKVLQYKNENDYANVGQLAMVSASHYDATSGTFVSPFLGYVQNDAPPSFNLLPSGATGWGNIPVAGDIAFGIYGQATLNAAYGGASGGEVTGWNFSTHSPYSSSPDQPGGGPSGLTSVVVNGFNVTCGTGTSNTTGVASEDCSRGIYVGSNNGLGGNQFVYGMWLSKARLYDLVLGAPSDNTGNIAFAGASGTGYTIVKGATVPAGGTISLPAVSGTDTFATLGQSQIFAGPLGVTAGLSVGGATLSTALSVFHTDGFFNGRGVAELISGASNPGACLSLNSTLGTGGHNYLGCSTTGADGIGPGFFQIVDATASNATRLAISGTGAVTIAQTLNIGAIPTSAGSGGLYVCVDTAGATYKKSACP